MKSHTLNGLSSQSRFELVANFTSYPSREFGMKLVKKKMIR